MRVARGMFRGTAGALALLAAAAGLPGVAAAQGPSTLTLRADYTQCYTTGATLDVYVDLSNQPCSVNGLQYSVVYPPATLQFVSAAILPANWIGVNDPTGFQVNTVLGTIDAAYVAWLGSPPGQAIPGPGPDAVARLTFTVVSQTHCGPDLLTFRPYPVSGTKVSFAQPCSAGFDQTPIQNNLDRIGLNAAGYANAIQFYNAPTPVTVDCPEDVPDPGQVYATGCGAITQLTHTDTHSNPGQCHDVITRAWFAQDACGNTGTHVQVITINDTQPPTLGGLSNLSVPCGSDIPTQLATTYAEFVAQGGSATDNCTLPATPGFESQESGQPCGPNAPLVRKYRVQDWCGNWSAWFEQTITVTDNIPPIIQNPDNVTIECDGNWPPQGIQPVPWQHTMHWPQLPDPYGWDVMAQTNRPPDPPYTPSTILADDWYHNGQPIRDIHFWGSWWSDVVGQITKYHVRIWSDVPAPPYSHPGAIVWEADLLPGDVLVTEMDAYDPPSQQGFYYGFDPPAFHSNNHVKFLRYDVTNLNIPLAPGTYWLSIGVDVADPLTTSWGWKTTASGWNDHAVYTLIMPPTPPVPPDPPVPWEPEWHPFETPPPVETDLAFVITSGGTAPRFGYAYAEDNCPPPPTVTFQDVLQPGACPNTGRILRTWTATDACGNTSNCTQIIRVVDTTPPVLSGCPDPGPIQVACASEVPPRPADPAATDVCGTATVTYGEQITNQTCPNRYTLVRTWTATDECGNSASCTQTIVVNDQAAPVLGPTPLPGNETYECEDAVPAAPQLTATDNCDGAVAVTYSETRTNPYSVCDKVITRTWTASDSCGNTVTHTQTITVQDTTPPVVGTVSATVGVVDPTCSSLVTFYVTITDNCCLRENDVTADIELINGTATLGPVTVTKQQVDSKTVALSVSCTVSALQNCTVTVGALFYAVDCCGNAVGASQTLPLDGRFSESFAGGGPGQPGNIVHAASWDGSNLATQWELDNVVLQAVQVLYDDRVAGDGLVIYKTDYAGGTLTFAGTLVGDAFTLTADVIGYVHYTYNVYANGGQLQSSTTKVVLHADAQGRNYGITATADAVVQGVGGQQPGYPTLNSAASGGYGTLTLTSFKKIAYTTPLADVSDAAPPTVTCPPPVAVQCPNQVPAPATNDAQFVAQGGSAGDNCFGTNVTITHMGDAQQGNVITRTYRATDPCGNWAECTQTITITDSTTPQITCPPAVTVQCVTLVPPGATTIAEFLAAGGTASDNCTPQEQLTVCYADNPPAPYTGLNPCGGTITRTYTVSDASNNAATCTQVITVNDDVPPTFTSPPADASYQCLSEVPPPPTPLPAATDNCGGSVTVVYLGEAGNNGTSCNNTFTRQWQATDVCGNSTVHTQTITVHDTTRPTFTGCPGNIIVPPDGDCTGATVSWTPPTASDNCGTPTVTATHTPPFRFPLGTTTVTYTADDGCSTPATCSFTVEVLDGAYVDVTVELVDGAIAAGPFTRCIQFEMWACPTYKVLFSGSMSFTQQGTVARAIGTFGPLPCGNFTCITARDPLHTLRSTAVVAPPGGNGHYSAVFTGSRTGGGNGLVLGNATGYLPPGSNPPPTGDVIDITDFAMLAFQFGSNVGANTTCSTAGPHTDFSGNATVGLEDFAAIQFNFGTPNQANCCGAPRDAEGGTGEAQTEVSVAELAARGLGYLAVVDVDGDGWITLEDVLRYIELQGAVLDEAPPPTQSTPTGDTGSQSPNSRSGLRSE